MSQEDKYQKLLKRFQQQPETTPEEVESLNVDPSGSQLIPADYDQNNVSSAKTGDFDEVTAEAEAGQVYDPETDSYVTPCECTGDAGDQPADNPSANEREALAKAAENAAKEADAYQSALAAATAAAGAARSSLWSAEDALAGAAIALNDGISQWNQAKTIECEIKELEKQIKSLERERDQLTKDAVEIAATAAELMAALDIPPSENGMKRANDCVQTGFAGGRVISSASHCKGFKTATNLQWQQFYQLQTLYSQFLTIRQKIQEITLAINALQKAIALKNLQKKTFYTRERGIKNLRNSYDRAQQNLNALVQTLNSQVSILASIAESAREAYNSGSRLDLPLESYPYITYELKSTEIDCDDGTTITCPESWKPKGAGMSPSRSGNIGASGIDLSITSEATIPLILTVQDSC